MAYASDRNPPTGLANFLVYLHLYVMIPRDSTSDFIHINLRFEPSAQKQIVLEIRQKLYLVDLYITVVNVFLEISIIT